MKTETEIYKRLGVLEPWYAEAENGSFRESVIKSAIDELEWVLDKSPYKLESYYEPRTNKGTN